VASSSVYLLIVNLPLNGSERFRLVNAFFNRSINLNNSYALTIRMIINGQTKKIGKSFSSILMIKCIHQYMVPPFFSRNIQPHIAPLSAVCAARHWILYAAE
jgi:hypothetical protein